MSRTTSVFLDFLRIAAAMVVFISHCSQRWSGDLFQVMKGIGHDAVVVFFVLSGYVIAFSTLNKARDGKSYALARLSRLYSVVLPALVLTFVLQVVGSAVNPGYYQGIVRAHDGLRMVLAAFFTQEIWWISASPATNPPRWSLGYEFWYYAIFGTAIFIKPWRWKLIVTTLIAVAIGYKVILLMPIWLMGVALYLYGKKVRLPVGLARLGFVVATAGFFAAVWWLPDYPVTHGFKPLFYSGAFVTDIVTGLFLAAAIGCFDLGFGASAVPAKLENGVRWMADHTFSLYVYHFPLIVFFTAIWPFDHHSFWQCGLVAIAILVVIVGLSALTESKRRTWHRCFAAIWDWIAPSFGGTVLKEPARTPSS